MLNISNKETSIKERKAYFSADNLIVFPDSERIQLSTVNAEIQIAMGSHVLNKHCTQGLNIEHCLLPMIL